MSITMTKRRALALRQAGANIETKERRKIEAEELRQRRLRMPIDYDPMRMIYRYSDGSPVLPEDPRQRRR